MESLSAAMLICLIFKQQWTCHETKIAISSQVWTHWACGKWSGACGRVHPGHLFQWAGLTREWLPQVAPSQLLATSGHPSVQKHTTFLPQWDSATQHLLGLDPRAVHPCLFHSYILTFEETEWVPRGSENQHRITQCKKEMSPMSLFFIPKFL